MKKHPIVKKILQSGALFMNVIFFLSKFDFFFNKIH